MSDDLRSRLKAIDPMSPDVPTEPVTSASSRRRLEQIMSTPIIDTPSDPASDPAASESSPSRPSSTTPWFAAIAALVVVAVAIGAVALTRGDEAATAGPPLELSGGVDDVMASCLAPSPDILRDMEVAFEGTVTAVDGEVVTLRVDQWFTPGDADVVTITAPAGMEALIGGVPFDVGGVYLVSATGGTVNYCGFSGPDSPELQALYDEAFFG
jgi:hypothetical protein